MTTPLELRQLRPAQLREHIVNGHPVDPNALAGWAYRGTSLGLPSVVERLTWKTFQKTFWRDPLTHRLMGWNVRLEQDGVEAPSRPKVRRGMQVTEGYYEVRSPEGIPTPPGFDRGLVVDYGLGPHPPAVLRRVKDPLVALDPGNADLLLGVSYLVVSGRCVETPTYFSLEREHPITEVPSVLQAAPGNDLLRLSETERAWAEELFEGILGVGRGEGLPSFTSTERATFWRCFNQAPAPLVRVGLRPMLHTLLFLPVVSGFGRPYFKLSTEERERFLSEVAADERYFVRQALVTLKTLACFAYFDDDRVRNRYQPPPGSGAAA